MDARPRDLATGKLRLRDRVTPRQVEAHSNCKGLCGVIHGSVELSRSSSWLASIRNLHTTDPYRAGAAFLNKLDVAVERHAIEQNTVSEQNTNVARHWLNVVLTARARRHTEGARVQLRSSRMRLQFQDSTPFQTFSTRRRNSLVERNNSALEPSLHPRSLPVAALLQSPSSSCKVGPPRQTRERSLRRRTVKQHVDPTS